ncbi:hypothetical protein [Terrabacter sp. Root181]|uniref:hypothetical protein n=1 Tax=Terrabacter sp. Root181 TaxID=1736484 RepID=UPI0012FAD7ED|nr:hypothetical protein [Terrabacter sp. Root181]
MPQEPTTMKWFTAAFHDGAGRAGVLRTDGELHAGAHGRAVPLAVCPEATAPVEASVGVVSLGPLDVRSVGPSLERAAQALRALLR